MKTIFAIAAVLAAVPAFAKTMDCRSPMDQYGGYTSIQIHIDGDAASVQGSQFGGMAHFIRKIGPYTLKLQDANPEVQKYADAEDVELSIIEGITGLNSGATFKEFKETGTLSLYCRLSETK